MELLVTPIKQGKMTFNTEQYQAMDDEVEKFLKVGFIEEVNYPDWLVNVMLVNKFSER